MRLLLIAALLALSACASAPKQDPNHQAYLDSIASIRSAQAADAQAQRDGYARMAEACHGDALCVREVAREATLQAAFAATGSARGDGLPVPAPYVAPRSTFSRVAEVVASNLSAGLPGVLVGGYVAKVQSDNSAAVAISGNQMLGSVLSGATQVASDAITTLPQLAPSVAISAGGSIYNGDATIAGGDLWGDGNRVGDNIQTGDINTGTQTSAGIIGNDNRQQSDGPWTTLPEPEPEPEPTDPIDPEG